MSADSVSAEFRPHPELATVPAWDSVFSDPAILQQLPLDVLLDLRRHVRRLDGDLEAAIVAQMAHHPDQPIASQVVDTETAAAFLGTSKDSLYRKHKRLRLGYIDPLDGRLKFTTKELTSYVARQRRG